ncbi:MAG: hypothetical protein ACE5KM_10345 [Planctomycetaceae bacterium]
MGIIRDCAMLAVVPNVTWYLLPLAVMISLAYSASRYESPESILKRAARLFVTILIFMAIVLGVLILLSRNQ